MFPESYLLTVCLYASSLSHPGEFEAARPRFQMREGQILGGEERAARAPVAQALEFATPACPLLMNSSMLE